MEMSSFILTWVDLIDCLTFDAHSNKPKGQEGVEGASVNSMLV